MTALKRWKIAGLMNPLLTILEKLSFKEIKTLYGILSLYSDTSKFILYQYKALIHLLQKATKKVKSKI